jgi:hypothetical protein
MPRRGNGHKRRKQASGFRLQTSGFRLQASDFRIKAAHIGTPVVKNQITSTKLQTRTKQQNSKFQTQATKANRSQPV